MLKGYGPFYVFEQLFYLRLILQDFHIFEQLFFLRLILPAFHVFEKLGFKVTKEEFSKKPHTPEVKDKIMKTLRVPGRMESALANHDMFW